MSYTNYDFSESLNRVSIEPAQVESVIAAWGYGDGMGSDTGGRPGWSDDSVTEWRGGFLFKLKDGRIAYLTGWCDYTGWGCQDGAQVAYFTETPDFYELTTDADDLKAEKPPRIQWDELPADLNKWLSNPVRE